MKPYFTGLAVAALLVAGQACSALADDAPSPQTPPASAAPAAQPEARAPDVPRPSLAPKTAEPASPTTAVEPLPPRHRRYAHRYHRHWHFYRSAYWEPLQIYWPYFHHNRIHWSRVPWFFHF